MPGRDGVYLLVTASRGEYVYQPFTEQNGNENEWRRNVLAAHRELLDWISQGAGPCPAHIGWNVYGKPLLEHHGAHKSGGTIQPYASHWDDDTWLVDPCWRAASLHKDEPHAI